MRAIAVVIAVALLAPSARAEDTGEAWYEGKAGRARKVNLIVTGSLGATVLASLIFRGSLQPQRCRWCQPPSLDANIREALLWDDIHAARRTSDVIALALPILGAGISVVPVLAGGGSTGEVMDVALPVLGTLAINQSLTQITKLAVARTRPAIHFAETPGAFHAEDHVSFFSGHTSFAFAAATSAAMVARQRNSRWEPYIWAGGMTLATSVAYLRIAGDKHYFSDVLVGAFVGTATGLIVPVLMSHDTTIDATVTQDVKAVSFGGTF